MGLRAREEKFLKPLTGKIRRRKVFVFDFETKNDDTQEKGWTRPINCGVDDGKNYVFFENDDSLDKLPWAERHLVNKKGLVDKVMRFILGHGSDDRTLIRKYQSKRFSIYAHNGGRFDDMFLIGWLRAHEDEYNFEIASVQSRIQRLDVWPKDCEKKAGHWSFFDSVSLLPLSLAQIGKTFCPEDAQKLDFDLDLHERTVEIAVTGNSTILGKRAEHLDVLTQAMVRDGEWLYLRDKKWWRKVNVVVEGEIVQQFEHALENKEALQAGDLLYVQGRIREVRAALGDRVSVMLNAWERYNALDNRTLHVGLERFHDLVEKMGGEVGITAPATAMKLFRRQFLDDPITRSAHFAGCNGRCKRAPCPRLSCDGTCHGCAHDFVRRGYYGGRTEMHREWGKHLRYFDINSSYPASMLEDMPVGRMVEGPPGVSVEMLASIAKNHAGFVECTVRIPKNALPPLPYKVEEGTTVWLTKTDGTKMAVPPGKLLFPTGTFSGVWSWEELKLLDHPLVKGAIVSVGRSVWYKKRPIFAEMVMTLYRYRQKHLDGCGCKDRKKGTCNPDYDEGLAYVAKLILNSLYGKFGMREERTGLVMVPSDVLTNDNFKHVRENGWPIDGEHETCRIWEVEHVAIAPYIIPQISAHITALSRVRLFEGMADVIHSGGKLFYLDTDSCLCDVDLSPELLDESRLGAWKLENPKHLIEGFFVLPKLYKLLAHEEGCDKDACTGCVAAYHLPSCKDNKKCERIHSGAGCAVSKQRMKGVGSFAQTAENFDRMLQGHTVRFERVHQHKTMLKKGWSTVHAMKDDRASGGIDDRAKKSLRTSYDKRQLHGKKGETIPIHIAPPAA